MCTYIYLFIITPVTMVPIKRREPTAAETPIIHLIKQKIQWKRLHASSHAFDFFQIYLRLSRLKWCQVLFNLVKMSTNTSIFKL